MGYKYKSQFCFYINWCFWKSEKNENKIFIFEALNLDVFLDRNKATPVGISIKGLVIACGGDWYLYLSLCTQPKIE